MIEIRQAAGSDYPQIACLVEAAFRDVAESDHREHFLVERLRRGATFIPELELVATDGDSVVGHVMMTRIAVGSHAALALAPLSVRPDCQGLGIGGQLLRAVHEKAAECGFGVSVLLGFPGYYHRFGYEPASGHGIVFPFDAPDECCMVAGLLPGALDGVEGAVVYPATFFE